MKLLWMVIMLIQIGSAAEVSELRLALPTKHIQLDPAKYEDMYSMVILNQIYARLLRYTPDGEIRTDLATSWETSADKTKYTFHLREAKFSDGSVLSAKNVESSLKRLFLLGASISGDLSLIKGVKSYRRSKNLAEIQIHALDARTLVIQTEQPTSLLFYLLAVPDCGVLKIEKPDAAVNFAGPKLAASGVYKIASESADQMRLLKWRASDFDSARPPQSVQITLLDKIDPAEAAKGKVTDTSNFVTYDDMNSPFKNLSGWRAVPSEAANERFIVMNPKAVPLEVRKWLAARIDSRKLVAMLEDKTTQPAFGFIPNCLPGHLKEPVALAEPALKLKEKIKLKVVHGDNLPYREKFYQFLRESWKHPQIQLEFEALPVAQALKMLFGKQGEVILAAKGIDYPEGFSVLSYFRSGIESNYFHTHDREIDHLLDLAAHEIDDQKRIELYVKIQKRALLSATAVPLAFGSFKRYYWSNRVAVVPANPVGAHFIPLEMLEMAAK